MNDPSDRFRSWLRTVVPGIWAAIIAGAAALGVPDWLTEPLGGVAETIIVPMVLAVLYPLLRSGEWHMPTWLTRVLMGSSVPPAYVPSRSAGRHRSTGEPENT